MTNIDKIKKALEFDQCIYCGKLTKSAVGRALHAKSCKARKRAIVQSRRYKKAQSVWFKNRKIKIKAIYDGIVLLSNNSMTTPRNIISIKEKKEINKPVKVDIPTTLKEWAQYYVNRHKKQDCDAEKTKFWIRHLHKTSNFVKIKKWDEQDIKPILDKLL